MIDFYIDFWSVLAPEMIPKSIKNGHEAQGRPKWVNWSQKVAQSEPIGINWSQKVAQSEPIGAKRPPKVSQGSPGGAKGEPKDDQNASKNRPSANVAKMIDFYMDF